MIAILRSSPQKLWNFYNRMKKIKKFPTSTSTTNKKLPLKGMPLPREALSGKSLWSKPKMSFSWTTGKNRPKNSNQPRREEKRWKKMWMVLLWCQFPQSTSLKPLTSPFSQWKEMSLPRKGKNCFWGKWEIGIELWKARRIKDKLEISSIEWDLINDVF